MTTVTQFDKQLADLVWTMVAGLQAGYSLDQVFDALATDAPEPAATSCRQVRDDFAAGLGEQALINWQQNTPSTYLAEVVSTMQQSRQSGGNLPALLDTVGEDILAKAGSDPAFYPAMKKLAQDVGAPLPAHVK
ncbi:MAG: type II secretion system F family protein [Chloroflexota bacterium]